MKSLQSFFLDFRTLALTLAKLKYLETILEEAQNYQADQHLQATIKYQVVNENISSLSKQDS